MKQALAQQFAINNLYNPPQDKIGGIEDGHDCILAASDCVRKYIKNCEDMHIKPDADIESLMWVQYMYTNSRKTQVNVCKANIIDQKLLEFLWSYQELPTLFPFLIKWYFPRPLTSLNKIIYMLSRLESEIDLVIEDIDSGIREIPEGNLSFLENLAYLTHDLYLLEEEELPIFWDNSIPCIKRIVKNLDGWKGN